MQKRGHCCPLKDGNQYPNSLGKKVTVLGTNVIKSSTASSTKNIGMICLEIAAMPTLAMELETNKQIPIGGVTRPIIKLKMTTIPK